MLVCYLLVQLAFRIKLYSLPQGKKNEEMILNSHILLQYELQQNLEKQGLTKANLNIWLFFVSYKLL